MRGTPPMANDVRIVTHLIENHGITSRSELLGLGISASAIDRRIAVGLLVSHAGGALVLPGVGDPRQQDLRAALLQRPDTVLAFETAAEIHRFPLGPARSDEIHLLTTTTRSGRSHLGSVHRTKHLPVDDVEVVGGMRVTTPERTFLDLAIPLSLGRLRRLGEQLLADQRMSGPRLSACAAPYTRRGRSGTRVRREVLSAILSEDPVHESVAEHTFARLCRRYGIHGLRPRLVPPWYEGLGGVVDFADPFRRTIVEVDGRRWRSTIEDRTSERIRSRAAGRNGWRAVRFGYDEIIQRPGYVIGELLVFLGLDHPRAA